MVRVRDITNTLEQLAPLSLQEKYDNAGLLVGDYLQPVTGVLLCLDITEAVLQEAIELKYNLIIAHHPIIFNGLKRLTGQNEVQRCVTAAIKNDIALYAAHTNLDNVFEGVNGKIAAKLGLENCRILAPMSDSLCKLVTYVPKLLVSKVRDALFEAGAGTIGKYDSCSFTGEGIGSFRAGEGAQPFVGKSGQLHFEPEIRLELVVPKVLVSGVVSALKQVHPYEEPAYDILPISNKWEQVGAGVVGTLPAPVSTTEFLNHLKQVFQVPSLRHTAIVQAEVQRIAVCGGSGSFLIPDALTAKADVYITADIKYHEFMQAEGQLVLVDAGHYETEQYTKDLMYEIISKKFPTFAVRISNVSTNPILYL